MKSFTYLCQINSLSGVILSVIYFMYIFAITGDSGDLSPFFLLEIFLTRVGSVLFIYFFFFLYTTLALLLSYPFGCCCIIKLLDWILVLFHQS